MVGQYIARAVADDVLPPVFLSQYKGKVDDERVRYVIVHQYLEFIHYLPV